MKATALAVRETAVEGLLETEARYAAADAKRLYLLSTTYAIGRSLEHNLQSLGLTAVAAGALREAGADLESVLAAEPEAASGDGGLGSLAADFLDSLASLDMPGFGYGLHYEYGVFRQEVDRGRSEPPEKKPVLESPWEISRPEESCVVPVYGSIEAAGGDDTLWLGWTSLISVPYDIPIVGYGGSTVNWLRLFAARAGRDFDLEIFNPESRPVGRPAQAEAGTAATGDEPPGAAGQELRLLHEYFLVSCAVRDLVRRFERRPTADFRQLAGKVAVQIDDTAPALAVVELMRVLVDEKNLPWEDAWRIVTSTCSYTSHRLRSQACERWPVALLERVLPRHLQILEAIDRLLRAEVEARWPGDGDLWRRFSIIAEGEARMAHLAIAGSHSVNGVSAQPSERVSRSPMPDFHALWPERLSHETHGVSPRRWLLAANPGLAGLLDEALGPGWAGDLEALQRLEPLAGDADFRASFAAVKRRNKERLARRIADTVRVAVDPATLFDVQVQPIHQSRRQLLNALHVAYQYLALVEDGAPLPTPKTYLFAGRAAAGDREAEEVCTLICALAEVINGDRRAGDRLRVVFLPDDSVSLAEVVVAAGELSEQLAVAGTAASGTDGMKLALNGALTLAARHGAGAEIGDQVGADNLFLFGLAAGEIEALAASRADRSAADRASDPALRRALEELAGDRFSPGAKGRFDWVRSRLVDGPDPSDHLADFESYRAAHERAGRAYLEPEEWWRKAILNVARSGGFSSDRTVRRYGAEIWDLEPVPR
jgi:starch phosphorylase